MSKFNTNNAFKKAEYSKKNQSFMDKHGTILGGGVLALGMILVGTQYSGNTNFSADLTNEEETIQEESTETTEEVTEVTETTEEVTEVTDTTEEVAEVTDTTEEVAEVTDTIEEVAEVTETTEEVAEVTETTEEVAEVTEVTEVADTTYIAPETVEPVNSVAEPIPTPEVVIPYVYSGVLPDVKPSFEITMQEISQAENTETTNTIGAPEKAKVVKLIPQKAE